MYTMHQETYWIFTLSTGQSINNLGFFIILNWIYGLLITFSSFTQGQTTVRSPTARIYGTFLPGHRIRPMWVNSNLSQYCKQSYNTVQAKTEMLVYQGFILTASYLFFRSSSLHHHEFNLSLLAHFYLWLFDKLETALNTFVAIGGRTAQLNWAAVLCLAVSASFLTNLSS